MKPYNSHPKRWLQKVHTTKEESASISIEQFTATLKAVALQTYERLAKHTDSEVTRCLIFRDSLSAVFGAVVGLLAHRRKLNLARVSDDQSPGEIAALFYGWTQSGETDSRTTSRTNVNAVLGSIVASIQHNLSREFMPAEYIGIAFESLYGMVPGTLSNKSLGLVGSTERRDRGVFFTPKELVDFVTKQTLAPYLENSKTAFELLSLRVADPAVGAGFFLLEAMRLLSAKLQEFGSDGKRLTDSQARRMVAENCLYGVDRDPLATAIARALIWLEARDATLSFSVLEDHIKTGDSLLDLPEEMLGKKRQRAEDVSACRDTLSRARNRQSSRKAISACIPSFLRCFSWEKEFPEVFSNNKSRRSGFDVILSNPPWGKIKPHLKEFYSHLDERVSNHQGRSLRRFVRLNGDRLVWPSVREMWHKYVAETRQYAQLLRRVIGPFGANGVKDRPTSSDADIYKFFMQRIHQLSNPHGRIGLIIPAGFHNSAGATDIRRLYFGNGTFEKYLVFENRKRLFPIHGMFKFSVAIYQRGLQRGIQKALFGLSSISDISTSDQTRCSNRVNFAIHFLKSVSGRLLTIPELRTREEHRLFAKLHEVHPPLGDKATDQWNVKFIRELDMTNDCGAFRTRNELLNIECDQEEDGTWISPKGERYFPLFEGRMVHQLDCAAKGYRNGQGRTSVWEPLLWSEKELIPHYYVKEAYVLRSGQRTLVSRAGFCDVTGHANERTALAALIPSKSACGNKVPTCEFDSDDFRLCLLWLAIANSFVVDWIVRRRVCTTLNFFQWQQIPFPRISPDCEAGMELVEAAAQLSYMNVRNNQSNLELENILKKRCVSRKAVLSSLERAQLRATIDALVAELFDLSAEEFVLILTDFPLLDRHQPALHGESKSTITQDKALLAFLKKKKNGSSLGVSELYGRCYRSIDDLADRVRVAEELGAVAYVPSELAARSRQRNPEAPTVFAQQRSQLLAKLA